MYESTIQPPLPLFKFLRRLLSHWLAAVFLLLGSLGLGIAGYMYFEKLSPIDAFLNSSMLLGGMGPIDMPKTEAGKIFAGVYALYAGLVFLIAAAIVFTPILHRILHRLHWSENR